MFRSFIFDFEVVTLVSVDKNTEAIKQIFEAFGGEIVNKNFTELKKMWDTL